MPHRRGGGYRRDSRHPGMSVLINLGMLIVTLYGALLGVAVAVLVPVAP